MDRNYMNTGLTIAFICKPPNHPTIINYNKFGNKYWDDTRGNKSKIGYYFVYYFKKKYVYIHKIINILQPIERPVVMEWESSRQILCLSDKLIQFTWNEWITGIGIYAPYTPTYFNTQTCSWSYSELHNHKDFNKFNFINVINTIEPPPRVHPTTPVVIIPQLDTPYDVTPVLDVDDDLVILKLLKDKATHLLTTLLRQLKCDELREKLLYFQNIVKESEEHISKINIEIDTIMSGEEDNYIINN